MKRMGSVGLATWMLERLTFWAADESLAGDLLEELQEGRSARWFWRQVWIAVATAYLSRARAAALPLLFACGWSLMYPAMWPVVVRSPLTQTVLKRLAQHDLPYSTGLHFAGVLVPAIAFVWVGFFVYLTSRPEEAAGVSLMRVLVSLSVSFNVFFVASFGEHLGRRQVDIGDASETNFAAHFAAFSLPLAASLFAALACGLPDGRRRRGAGSIAGQDLPRWVAGNDG